MPTPGRHLLFLSHAGVDTDAARALATRIEQSPEAREHGLRVWLDRDDLVGGTAWRKQIEHAIDRDSTAFAVLVGAHGIVNWVEVETDVGLARAVREAGYPFLPILSKRCSRNLEDVLPPFVRRYEALRNVEDNAAEFAKLIAAALGQTAVQPTRVDEPFVGLRSFESADANLFFGRERETKELLDRLRHNNLVMVVGDSGSGKSSLVKAGLLPRFRGGALADPQAHPRRDAPWHVIETRPQREPFEALADELARVAGALGTPLADVDTLRARIRSREPDAVRDALIDGSPLGARILFVVDQFEELWTQCDEAARVAYARALLRLADPERPSPIRVVLTMRRDYYNRCRTLPELYARLEQPGDDARPGPKYALRRMEDAGIGHAVTEPLRRAGADDNPALVEKVVTDVRDQPGDLTLLQVALYECWRKRHDHGGNLLAAYAAIGGVTGALATAAGERLDDLDDAERRAAEAVFLRLVRLGEAGGTTRRVAARDEFSDDAWRLVQKFATEQFRRLVAVRGEAGAETAELQHEALLTQWDQYQAWLQDAATDKRVHDRLIPLAQRWEQAGHADDCLLTGRDLEDALALRVARPQWLSPSEAALLADSEARRDADLRAAQEFERLARLDAERQLQRSRVLAAVFLGLTIGAATAAWWAWSSEQRARDASAQTFLREALGQIEHARPDAALAYLAAGLRRGAETSALRVATLDLLQRHSWPLPRVVVEHKGAVNSAAFSPDGRRIVTASGDKSARVWDARTGQPITGPLSHEGPVNSAAFSPDGRRVVTASDDQSARVWDARTGQPLTAPLKDPSPVTHAVFSHDGQRVTTTTRDGFTRDWDAQTGVSLSERSRRAGGSSSATLSPDERYNVTASDDNSVRVWDVGTGKPITDPLRHGGPVWGAAFSPDGLRLVTTSTDGVARVWNVRGGEPLTEPLKHSGAVWSASFSPDNHHVVTASDDHSACVWDARTDKALTEPWKHSGPISSGAFSADGRHVVTTSADDSTWVWDARSGRFLTYPWLRGAAAGRLVESPDGLCVATTPGDDSARIWDARTGRPVTPPLQHEGRVTATAFSPDGLWLVTASDDGSARVWDARTGAPVTPPLLHPGKVSSAAFSPDGRRVVTTADDQAARLWDARTGQALTSPLWHRGLVTSVAFSPDGRLLVTNSWDSSGEASDGRTVQRAAMFSPQSGTSGILGSGIGSGIFGRSGLSLVKPSFDRFVRVWDVRTGEAVTQPLQRAGRVWTAAFSSDGRRVVTTSSESSARVWNAATGEPISEPLQHAGLVWSANFSPDGLYVVTSSYDKSARVWDVRTGKPLTVPLQHAGPVWNAVFSPDGLRVVTASADNSARVWDLPAALQGDARSLADLAEAVAGLHVSEEGALVTVPDRVRVLDRLRRRSADTPFGQPTALSFMRWFFADPWERPISPFSAVTVPEYIRRRLAEGDPDVRAALERDFPGHPSLRRDAPVGVAASNP